MPECGLRSRVAGRIPGKAIGLLCVLYFEKGAAHYFSVPPSWPSSGVRRDRAVVDHPDARIPVMAEAVEGRSAAATGGPQNQAHRCCPARRIDLRLYCCAPRSWRAAASSDLRTGRTSIAATEEAAVVCAPPSVVLPVVRGIARRTTRLGFLRGLGLHCALRNRLGLGQGSGAIRRLLGVGRRGQHCCRGHVRRRRRRCQ